MKTASPKIYETEEKELVSHLEEYYFTDAVFRVQPAEVVNINNVTFNSCRFERIDFENIRLENVSLIDCIFQNCDLSNKSFDSQDIRRVIFSECKLMGTSFIEAGIKDVEIRECNASFVNFSGGSIKNLRFVKSMCKNMTINNAKAGNLVFDRCDLTAGEFYNTSLAGVDLSDCEIKGIGTDAASLRGLIVNWWQAGDILTLFGVKIKKD